MATNIVRAPSNTRTSDPGAMIFYNIGRSLLAHQNHVPSLFAVCPLPKNKISKIWTNFYSLYPKFIYVPWLRLWIPQYLFSYSFRSYTPNLVKITLVVSEAENGRNGRKHIHVAVVHLSDLVDLKKARRNLISGDYFIVNKSPLKCRSNITGQW